MKSIMIPTSQDVLINRKKKGLTQAQLSELTHIKISTISRIENDLFNVIDLPARKIEALNQALNLDRCRVRSKDDIIDLLVKAAEKNDV